MRLVPEKDITEEGFLIERNTAILISRSWAKKHDQLRWSAMRLLRGIHNARITFNARRMVKRCFSQ